MPKVLFKDYEGNDIQTVEVESGVSLMQAALDNGIEGIDAECAERRDGDRDGGSWFPVGLQPRVAR